MATTRKPAPRTAKKRGPTKAAALKALGLTQADLDAIKALHEAPAEAMQSVPAEVRAVAEPAPEPEPKAPEGPQTFFVRNLRHVEVGIRLERQSDQKTKRLDLKGRGTRGDIKPLQPEDLHDSTLIANVELGVVEIITAAEAQKAIKGQVTNAQAAVHPAMAMLRNPLGEEYAEGAVQGVEDYVDESVVVAHLNPVGGEFGEIQFNRANRGSFERNTQAPEQGRQLGGNPHIVSDGFAAARAADDAARSKNLEGPAAGLGGIQTVVIEQPKEVRVPKPKGS